MVVLLQELEVESISNFALEDSNDLCESLLYVLITLLLVILELFFDMLKHFGLVRLVFLITDVKCNLESVKVRVIFLLNQFFEK